MQSSTGYSGPLWRRPLLPKGDDVQESMAGLAHRIRLDISRPYRSRVAGSKRSGPSAFPDVHVSIVMVATLRPLAGCLACRQTTAPGLSAPCGRAGPEPWARLVPEPGTVLDMGTLVPRRSPSNRASGERSVNGKLPFAAVTAGIMAPFVHLFGRPAPRKLSCTAFHLGSAFFLVHGKERCARGRRESAGGGGMATSRQRLMCPSDTDERTWWRSRVHRWPAASLPEPSALPPSGDLGGGVWRVVPLVRRESLVHGG